MATLTLELPETPQAQAAYRLAADCPHCGAPLVLRQNRQTGALFTGCSAYPGCAFTVEAILVPVRLFRAELLSHFDDAHEVRLDHQARH